MQGTGITHKKTGLSFQAESVVVEYTGAVRRGATELIKGIREANPDLTTEFNKVDALFENPGAVYANKT